MLLLVKLQASARSITPPCVFFIFLKLYKWYPTTPNIRYNFVSILFFWSFSNNFSLAISFFPFIRSTSLQTFFKTSVFKNFAIFTGKNLCFSSFCVLYFFSVLFWIRCHLYRLFIQYMSNYCLYRYQPHCDFVLTLYKLFIIVFRKVRSSMYVIFIAMRKRLTVIYLVNVNRLQISRINQNTQIILTCSKSKIETQEKRCEIYLKLTTKTRERCFYC